MNTHNRMHVKISPPTTDTNGHLLINGVKIRKCEPGDSDSIIELYKKRGSRDDYYHPVDPTSIPKTIDEGIASVAFCPNGNVIGHFGAVYVPMQSTTTKSNTAREEPAKISVRHSHVEARVWKVYGIERDYLLAELMDVARGVK